MAGYPSTENRSNFVHFKEASLCSFECQHYVSLFYTRIEKCFDKILFHYQDTICYIDPTSCQTYSFAREITCVGNAANIIALDPDGND